MRLSEKETIKLLELYRQEECLWNDRLPIHTNRQVRQMKFEAIAREMNIENFNALAVRNKIKNLRSTYKLELKKIKRLKKEGYEDFSTHLRWFNIMDSIFKMQRFSELPEDDESLENGGDSQCELQTVNSVEITSVSVSSAPSIPNESETELDVKSIFAPETITPDIQNVRSLPSSDFYSVIPVSDSAVTTVPSGIPIAEPVSDSVVTTVPSGIPTAESVSNSAVTTVPSGIQTAKTASTPKVFALIPDIQTSKSVSNPRFITVSAKNNQNVRYVSGSPGVTLAPESQKKIKRVSSEENLLNRKRRPGEVNSTDSNADVHQINNTRPVIGDFSDRSADEMDAFGHFVALNLRKMSMQSALSAQSEILSVLTRHRLNDSATNQPSKQTIPCIVTNGGSSPQNQAVLQKLFFQKLK